MGARTGIRLDYRSLAECPPAQWAAGLGGTRVGGEPGDRSGSAWRDVLGLAAFNRPAPAALGDAGIPVSRVGARVLAGARDVCEIWRTDQRVRSGQFDRIRYRCTDALLFGAVSVAEQAFAGRIVPARATSHGALPVPAAMTATTDESTPLREATEQVYRDIYAALDGTGYPHLVRIWNYLTDINGDDRGTERYRQFNIARQDAVLASGRAVAGNVPAACALGTDSGDSLVIYFIASRTAPVYVENPRQVSAYNYPPQYGLRSPAFSRATVLHEPASLTLFISGTASIVGHETLHAGDAAAQTRETLTNIEALVQEANRRTGGHFTPASLASKVYVRHPADLPIIRAELHAKLGTALNAVYLKADICRQDLLVEIEATGHCGP